MTHEVVSAGVGTQHLALAGSAKTLCGRNIESHSTGTFSLRWDCQQCRRIAKLVPPEQGSENMRTCAICGKTKGAMATFLTLLMRWGLAGKSMFAHPECIARKQKRKHRPEQGKG